MQKRKKNIRKRLLFLSNTSLVMGIALLTAFGYGYRSVRQIMDRYHGSVSALIELDELNLLLAQQQSSVRALMLKADEATETRKLKQIHSTVQSDLEEISKLFATTQEAATIGEAAKSYQDQVLVQEAVILGQIKSNNPALLKTYNESYQPAIDEMSDLILSIQIQSLQSAKQDELNLSGQFQKMGLFILIVLLGGTLFTMIYGRIVALSVSRELERLSEKMNTSAQTVAKSSDVLRSISHQLTSAAHTQSNSVDTSNASAEEISAMLVETVKRSEESFQLCRESQSQAQNGQEVIGRLVESMNQIQESNTQMQRVVKIVEEINNKTKVINDIAFKSKLLALNAAIEAAHAGSHGTGFSVVATEVGSLAEASEKSANEIRALLDTSLVEVQRVVSDTQSRAASSIEISRECQQSFEIMLRSVNSIFAATERINHSAKEQEIGVLKSREALTELKDIATEMKSTSDLVKRQTHESIDQVQSMMSAVETMQDLLSGDETQRAA